MSEDSDNIVEFPSATVVEFPESFLPIKTSRSDEQICSAKDVLDGALEAGLKNVVVIGLTENGDPFLASSYRFMADTFLLTHRAANMLVHLDD